MKKTLTQLMGLDRKIIRARTCDSSPDALVDGLNQNLVARLSYANPPQLLLPPTLAALVGSSSLPLAIGASSYTWAGKPTAAAAGAGAEILITDYGIPGIGLRMRSDGTVWRPSHGRQLLYVYASTAYASPVASVAGSGALTLFTLPTAAVIPAGMGYLGFRVGASFRVKRTAIAGVPVSCNIAAILGTGNNSSDVSFASVSIANTLNADGDITAYADYEDATHYSATGFLPPNSAFSNTQVEKTTNVNFAAAMNVNLTVPATAIAGDTFVLLNGRVWIEG